jgi:LytS/YehU family sensor histidine kinase
LVPPLLLVPFIENIFKHGVDKIDPGNYAHISLKTKGDYLIFLVVNRCMKINLSPANKFGLKNLEERLRLLYDDNYILQTEESDGKFSAYLKIPCL